MATQTRPKVCIDRLLPAETHRFQSTIRRSGSVRAILVASKMWMNGSTLRVRFLGGNGAQQAKAREQAAWWSEVANLHFDFNDAPNAEIRIAFDPDDGAWSYIGTDNRNIPLNQPTMNLGFLDGGTAAHEFGHAIGLGHEHQNPAGGIEWNEAVVIQNLSGPPNNWDEATIRHNVIEKYSVDQIRGTQFDPKSIMLYFFPANWTTNGIGTEANDVLSALDRGFIASAAAYPKTAPTVADAVELKVNASRRTKAAIGKPGEEDLYRFTVTEGGKHVIDTKGPTDLVMKLFGPDSQTDVIAEDDDSGVGFNARIAGALVPGNYYVQVRHFSRSSGVGEYSVRVRRA